MTRLVIAPRAREQVRQISAWWRANREAAPNLFAEELADRIEALLLVAPRAGAIYAERRGDATTETFAIRAVWHSARGHGPTL